MHFLSVPHCSRIPYYTTTCVCGVTHRHRKFTQYKWRRNPFSPPLLTPPTRQRTPCLSDTTCLYVMRSAALYLPPPPCIYNYRSHNNNNINNNKPYSTAWSWVQTRERERERNKEIHPLSIFIYTFLPGLVTVDLYNIMYICRYNCVMYNVPSRRRGAK